MGKFEKFADICSSSVWFHVDQYMSWAGEKSVKPFQSGLLQWENSDEFHKASKFFSFLTNIKSNIERGHEEINIERGLVLVKRQRLDVKQSATTQARLE